MRRIEIILLLLALCTVTPLSAAATPSEDCLGCHSDAANVGKDFAIDPGVFDTTAHAELGCPSCHSVDARHPDSGAAPSKANCQECHAEIAQEYQLSQHHPNASCSECHNPHRVRGPTEVSGVDMNRVCSDCHELEAMATAHTAWLPQADLHVGALPCVSCHTAARDNVITLYIIKKAARGPFSSFELASYDELRPLTKDGKVETLIDLNADNYISLAELRLFNTNPERVSLRLHGMMTPETVTHDFQILANRRDCTFCHASGTAARQTSYLSLANADGSYRRVAVERGAVLDALYGTPDFYMVGSTRSKALDYIGGAIIACGLIVPIGHGTLRFLTRRNRANKEE
jgi:predicted CXXCH cytochrome family protein